MFEPTIEDVADAYCWVGTSATISRMDSTISEEVDVQRSLGRLHREHLTESLGICLHCFASISSVVHYALQILRTPLQIL